MPADPTSAESNFVTSYRGQVRAMLAARKELKAARERAATQGYPGSFSPDNPQTGTGAFSGANADLVAGDITAAIAALDALEMVLTDFATTPPTPTAHLAALIKVAG